MKRIFTEGHWSPYSGKTAEYVHRIQDNVDRITTNRWILNPKYGFAWMEDNRGWVSVMKPKVFRVGGERRYGYQVYGLSKNGTLRDKSSNWWDTPDEAQENIKRIFKIDMAQESTRGNMKMKRRIMKESQSKGEMLELALKEALNAKNILAEAADNIRCALGTDYLWERLDSHSNDLDDTIDDIKSVLNGMSDEEYASMVDEEPMNESVSGNSGWFDELGQLTPPDWAIDKFGIVPGESPLPEECVRACSHPGNCDYDVSAWVDELKFDQNFPVERARKWLRGYGAWDDKEIEQMSARELAEKALWIFSGDISDGETYCTMNA